MSWTVRFWCDSENLLRRILGLFSIVVLKASEVSTAALDIHEDFDVLLTVHLSIFILAVNQLDAQNFVLQ